MNKQLTVYILQVPTPTKMLPLTYNLNLNR